MQNQTKALPEWKKCGDCPAFRPLFIKSAPCRYRQSNFGLCGLRENTVRPYRGRICKHIRDAGEK